jgi:hypothetical protein
MRLLALSFLVVWLAQPAAAGGPGDLTGTWLGSFRCKTESANGKDRLDSGPAQLLISQLGPSGPLVANLVSKGSGRTRARSRSRTSSRTRARAR